MIARIGIPRLVVPLEGGLPHHRILPPKGALDDRLLLTNAEIVIGTSLTAASEMTIENAIETGSGNEIGNEIEIDGELTTPALHVEIAIERATGGGIILLNGTETQAAVARTTNIH